MKKTEPSIGELISHAIMGDEFNHGSERVFFRLPSVPGILIAIPTYLALKIQGGHPFAPARDSVSQLLASTSLTPVIEPIFNGLAPSTPGAPIAAMFHPSKEKKIPYALFIPEVKGKSFLGLLYLEDTPNLSIDNVISWPPETFEHLMRQARIITELNLGMDNSLGNILQEVTGDDGALRLRIIDLCPEGANDFFTVLRFFDTILYREPDGKKLQLYNKLVDAAVEKGFGAQREAPPDFPKDLAERLRKIPPLVIAREPQAFPDELDSVVKLYSPTMRCILFGLQRGMTRYFLHNAWRYRAIS